MGENARWGQRVQADLALTGPEVRVRIRDAQEEDLPALEWEGEYRRFRTVFRRTYQEAQAGRRWMLVAEEGGEVVGQVFVQLCSSERHFADGTRRAYLYAFRVRPGFRGRGIGTHLMQAAETRLRERGFREAVIAVSQDNPEACRLYERLGYRIFMEDPGEWSYLDHEMQRQEVVEPCWVLEKQL